MNQPKFIFSIAAFLFVCLLGLTNSSAQTTNKQQSEPSYEVVLHVLIASNIANDKLNAVPPALSNVVKNLKTNYSFSNYRLAQTYFQRVANTGNVSSNGISSEPNQDVFAPVFSEWAIEQLLISPNETGRNSISIRNFRFGQRVPIKTAISNAEDEKAKSIVSYQQIGIWAQKLNLAVNSPTVIGNLTTSKPNEAMFLILTVKPVEE